MMRTATLYAIGHGNRSLDEFIRLLTEQAIESLVDVRAQLIYDRHVNAELDL